MIERHINSETTFANKWGKGKYKVSVKKEAISVEVDII